MIDSFLIEKVYQPISDKVMDWTHRSCFWLAGQAVVASAVSFFAFVIAANGPGDILGLVLSAIYGLWAMTQYRDAQKEDSRFWSGSTTLRARPVHEYLGLQLALLWGAFIIGLSVVAIVQGHGEFWLLLSCGTFVALVSYYCFMACRPKPPRRQRQTAFAFQGAS